MRKTTIIIASVLLLLTKNVNARSLWDANKSSKFTISSGSLNINGTSFDKPWKINPFLSAIGGKYVIKNLFHKVYTFDDFGVHIYEYPQKEEANEVQISFVNQKLKFAPKNNFRGSFKIEKISITRKTNMLKVIKALPDYKFVKGNQGNFYRGEFKGVYIYLNYSDNSFELLDFISFGMTGRN